MNSARARRRSRRNRTLAALCVAAAGSLSLGAATASAATIPVTTFDDVTLNDAFCSLREAVKSADTNSNAHEDACTQGQAHPTADLVTLSAGTYALAGAGGEDLNVSGDLDLASGGNDHLTIDGALGPGEVPTSVIDAANLDRIFEVGNQGAATPVFTVQDVELRNGNVSAGVGAAGDGGAIRIGDADTQFTLDTVKVLNSDAGRYGGAVSFESGPVGPQFTVRQSEFAGNTALDDGGALYYTVSNDTAMTIDTSALVGNSSGDDGGAVYVAGDESTLTMKNSTLSGNSATGGGGGLAFGAPVPTINVFFSTIAGNTTPTAGQGGGVQTDSNSQIVNLVGTILSGNTAAGAVSNCDEVVPGGDGVFASNDQGYNLESANTCDLDTGMPDFSLINTDPLLAPLATNVGTAGIATTRTHGLYDTSPALNRVPRSPDSWCDNFHTNGQDQRFEPRPPGPGGLCDVGAFEGSVGPVPPPPAVTSTPSNAFSVGELDGRKLSLTVGSAGTAEVTDASTGASASGLASAAAKRLLKTSTASGGPGTITIALKLTKRAKAKLKAKGKVKVRARITFTPAGGTPASQTTRLTIKR